MLQEVKRQLREQGIEQQGITILSEPGVDYQTIVHAMDTVRSFKALVAASVVDAALFPQISFGDAPTRTAQQTSKDLTQATTQAAKQVTTQAATQTTESAG